MKDVSNKFKLNVDSAFLTRNVSGLLSSKDDLVTFVIMQRKGCSA